ncbi:unnamed protein product [Brassicogethes aeneus]|uniref:15-hydroxyprostaglandin dehydrogenase [NAD(+)]-like n=1 Tax=Brassicogethes aeneus TaxID=1431903 RepID=A0A9P0FJV3_BRAAE|nr:unnamed protein product [Brassicogethes aeneus]
MVFEIKNKVALVTGGASGIGFEYCRELLKNGAKAVTIADVNEALGDNALLEVKKEFGENRAIFVKTDVSNKEEFENAFKKTVQAFKNIDILINNAAVFDPPWERIVAVNVNGTINGNLLAQSYLPKHRTSEDQAALIVNVGSMAGLNPYSLLPVYSATKFAIQGLTRTLGDPKFNDCTKLRIIGIFPGATDTPKMKLFALEHKWEEKGYEMQSPKQCAEAAMVALKNAESGSIWVVDEGKTYEYKFSN